MTILQDVGIRGLIPQGETDIMLGKSFGGIDLSGGQWQRLAIGRSIYRDRELMIFDEPTAAIDPLEEKKLFDEMFTLSRGKTVVYVTHRLGFVKNADKIVFMQKGEITEYGTFDQLIERQGCFYEMWQSQSQWYNGIN